MTELDRLIEKAFLKIFFGMSELFAIILTTIMTAVSGLLIFFSRKYIYKFLDFIGITYFSSRLKNIRDINSDLIYCQGAFRADVYGLFRTYNGRSYVEENTFSGHESDAKKIKLHEKIIIRKMNSRPDEFFPTYLDKELYKIIIKLTVANDWKIFSYDSLKTEDPNSKILVLLESTGIEYLMTFRIWDKDKKTYGIILFAWVHKPNIDDLFTRDISKKLDSISIRFLSHIESSLAEKLGIRLSM